ncbi:DUF1413 domain-containing protein [Rhodobacteraceae bacterium]|nr:DUF1413 domain-containing protein [Paracoccaceae bacterium]
MMNGELLKQIKATIKKRADGAFHLSDIYGGEWDALYVGDQVRLGREFLRLVQRGDIKGVRDSGEKSGGGRLYIKSTP